jgi:hypothetical protein
MPATRGSLRKFRLNGTPDTGPSTFELANFNLPTNLANYPPHTPATTPQEVKKLHRKGFKPGQLEMMGKVVQHYEAEYGFQEMMGQGGNLTDGYAPVGPEFTLHGTATDWDTLHASGGLGIQGKNPDVDQHVFSSSTHGTGYVSTTRVLSVAKSFAKTNNGWVYLVYVASGVGVFDTSRHTQAEVSAVGPIPIDQFYMFKQLNDPNLIYVNLGFRGVAVTPQIQEGCFRYLGGGTYPNGQFWAMV